MSDLPAAIGQPSHLPNGHPLVFDDERGAIVNDFDAEQLNAIAVLAFQASRPLFELGRNNETLILDPDAIMRLANHFEEIGFLLGDGVLFDR